MQRIKQTKSLLNQDEEMLGLQKKIDQDRIPGETEEERVDRLMLKYFVPHYSSAEEFEKDLYEKIEIAHKQIEEGKGIPAEIAFKELEAKYGFHE